MRAEIPTQQSAPSPCSQPLTLPVDTSIKQSTVGLFVPGHLVPSNISTWNSIPLFYTVDSLASFSSWLRHWFFQKVLPSPHSQEVDYSHAQALSWLFWVISIGSQVCTFHQTESPRDQVLLVIASPGSRSARHGLKNKWREKPSLPSTSKRVLCLKSL